MADSKIKTGELRNISTSIRKDAEKLNDLYTGSISKALDSCRENLVVSGLNVEEIQTSFKVLFTDLVNQLNEFVDAMDTKILPQYELTATSITRLFNQDFANEMNEYLKIIKGN